MNFKFYYVDSHTGSGKTFALRFVINPNSKAIIGTPRTGVSKEIADDLRALGITVKVISGKTHANCTKAFRSAVKEGKFNVIIANHAVVMRKHPGTEEYDLYIDEAPKVDEQVTLNETHEHLQESFASILEENIGTDSAFFELKYTECVADIILQHNKTDDTAVTRYSDSFIRFCYARKDPDYQVIIRADELRQYKEKRDNDGKLHFHLLKQPSLLSGYKSVTIMAANFLTMEVYRHWQKLVEFVPHQVMTESLRYSDFSHKAGKVHILFVSEAHDTKYSLDKLGYQYFLDKAAVAHTARFGDAPHIYCTRKNKEKLGEDPFVWRAHNGIQLDPNAKGINGCQHINIAVHFAPLNPPTRTYKFKKQYFGMESEDLKAAIAYDGQYQFMSRTSIRNYDSQDDVYMIVLDRKSADELAKKFGPACAGPPEFFDIGIPELREEKSEAVDGKTRAKKCRTKKKLMDVVHDNTQQYEEFLFKQWSHKGCTEPVQVALSWNDIVHYLTNQANTVALKSKSNSMEFREGFFKDHENHKLRDNITSTKLLLFDVDKSTRSPAELSNFLKRNKISHLITNSFSSTAAEPRFHVIVPMSEAVNAENYKRIFKLLKADIRSMFGDAYEIEDKYSSMNHRISNPTISNFKGGFVIDGTVWQDIMTYTQDFLNVRFFLNERNQIADYEGTSCGYGKKSPINDNDADNETTARTIVDRWAVAPGQGLGRKHFYQAGVDLKKAGFSHVECVQTLAENRHLFGHGQDRDAKAVADSVFSRSRFAA